MKTLVMAKHETGKFANGHDGCHARWANDGNCPGDEIARWLNGLGEDHEPYGPAQQGRRLTAGEVRDNYLRDHGHVVAVDPALAALLATERRLSAELRVARKQIRRAQAVKDEGLEGVRRCEHEETSQQGRVFRRCVRDAGHAAAHEFGSWCMRD